MQNPVEISLIVWYNECSASTRERRREMIEKLTKEMKAAAKLLEFEHAAYLRDKIKELQNSK